MANQGIYIFENETDFLRAMEQLNQYYYWNKPKAICLSKKLETSRQLNKELAFINKCNINAFSGFRTAKQIKINITDGLNCNYCITYCFNSSTRNSIYDKLNRYLKKRTNIYV